MQLVFLKSGDSIIQSLDSRDQAIKKRNFMLLEI